MTLGFIPDGNAGTDATLKAMRRMILAGKVDPLVRQFSASLVAPIRPQKQFYQMITAIFYFVRDQIAYVPDIAGVETIHPANFILQHRYGDCDDKSILLCSMLASIGFACKLVAVGATPAGCTHVYTEVKLGRHWIPLDPTEHVEPGWSPSGVMCRRTLEI